MATLGISSLFLFAGLEVNLRELRRNIPRLSAHLALRAAVFLFVTYLGVRFLHVGWQVAAMLFLALFTPSTGFILDALPTSGLDEGEQSEVATSAIAGEILALLLLLVVSQANSTTTLLVSAGALVLLIAVTPFVFIALTHFVVP